MVNSIARLFLTISAISFFVVIYMVKSKYNILDPLYPDWVSYFILYPFFSILILTPLALWICKRLPDDKIDKIDSVESANNEFLPNYLAFFFVALAIPNHDPDNVLIEPVFLIIFITMTALIFVSRVSYFNPIFLIFNYNFYYMITSRKVKIMLISKKKYKRPEQIKFLEVKRINDYAFIEVE